MELAHTVILPCSSVRTKWEENHLHSPWEERLDACVQNSGFLSGLPEGLVSVSPESEHRQNPTYAKKAAENKRVGRFVEVQEINSTARGH